MPSKELKKIISRWQDWLTLQRNCSEHTIQSYLSDLYIFLEYLSPKEEVGIPTLKQLDIKAFRNFFSIRAKKGISKTSIAREESAVRNFFKWLNENKILKNRNFHFQQ